MVLKLDMSKAYDRVKWKFLEAIMQRMGFAACWINLIMEAITTSRFAFILNGVPQGEIIPSRGIRQGCLLSPYLFLVC